MKMIKTSKVKSIQANGTWETTREPKKMFYKFEVEMTNGDCGEYSSKTKDQEKFVVGQETEYEFIDGKYPKIKPVYNNPNAPKKYRQEDPARQKIIVRQSSLRTAVEYLKGAEASLEEIFEAADAMIDYVNCEHCEKIGADIKESINDTAQMMHDLAKNANKIPGNDEDDKLPF